MPTSRRSSVPIPRPPDRSNLNLPKVFNGIPFRNGNFTIEELDTGLAALTCDKAAGVDEIVNEILRRPELSDCLLDILNMCYTSKTVPNEWHISLLVPVFKKGNPSMCTNYRGIALMSTCAKLYNRLLLGRIRDGLIRMAFVPFDLLVSMFWLGDVFMRRLLRPNLQASTQPSLTSRKPLTLSTGTISRT